MISSLTTAYAGAAALADQQAASVKADSAETSADAARPQNGAIIADTVTLSPAAQAASTLAQRSAGYYEQFFPTREGYSSTALAAAIVDPGAESFSAGKSLPEVAEAARMHFDQIYADMKASGKPFDVDSWEGADWNALMGDLDRRALYAVSNNQDGAFTNEEQDIARSIMSSQQGWGMGLGGGPTRLVEGMTSPFGDDFATQFRIGASWLDQCSPDEKMSVAWASQRAGLEASYANVTEGRNDIASANPLVKLIRSAMSTMTQGGGRESTQGNIWDLADLLKQPWFEGFESSLGTAMAQTKEYYAQNDAQARAES